MKLPTVQNREELTALIEEVGFLPFFTSEMPGFSVMSVTRGLSWWSGDDGRDPWQWRILISSSHRLAYAKLFRGKAGFVSPEWLPVFANYRRDGYDFDALFDDGKASYRSKLIMDLFSAGTASLPTFEIKRLANFGKDGVKGFEGAVTALQMQTYLTISDFTQKRNKRGEPYGWPVGVLAPPESVFGEELVRSRYSESPKISFDRLVDRVGQYVERVSDDDIRKFLK